jgi:hypothetical protein
MSGTAATRCTGPGVIDERVALWVPVFGIPEADSGIFAAAGSEQGPLVRQAHASQTRTPMPQQIQHPGRVPTSMLVPDQLCDLRRCRAAS